MTETNVAGERPPKTREDDLAYPRTAVPAGEPATGARYDEHGNPVA